MTIDRPAAEMLLGAVDAEAQIKTDSTLYIYLNIPQEMRRAIPSWLWKKKVENVKTSDRAMSDNPSIELFKEKSVDVLTLIDDLSRRGYKPFHIHVMVREHGGFRVRIGWLYQPLVVLTDEEIDWMVSMFSEYVWDTQAHNNIQGTEHLPSHIAIGCANMTHRIKAIAVHSVQIFEGYLALLNDPSEGQELVSNTDRAVQMTSEQVREALGTP